MSKKCANCATENYDSAIKCRHCGEAFRYDMYVSSQTGLATKNVQKNILDKSTKILVVIIVFIVILIAFLIGMFIVTNVGADSNTVESDMSISDMNQLSANLEQSADENDDFITGVNDIALQSWDNYIAVTAVELDYKNIELEEGDVFQLNAAVKPKEASVQTVLWSTSDASVASVDEYGTVTANAAGTAYIYVYSYDEQQYDVCEVIINNKTKLVEPQSMADYGKYIVKVDTYLSLRYGPDAEYGEIKRINNNEELTVYAYENDKSGNTWAYVKYNGKLGWVYDNFLVSKTQTVTDNTVDEID